MPEASEDIWRFVSLPDFAAPAPRVKEAVRSNLREIWTSLWARGRGESAAASGEDEVEAIPDDRLAAIVSPLGPDRLADALDVALSPLVDGEEAGRRSIFVVGAPHSGVSEAVACWAERRGWQSPDLPSRREVLAGEDGPLGDLDDDTPWAVSRLERCYVRRVQGLEVVRRLLERARTAGRSPRVVACDSWAWRFLRFVQPSATVPLTLQAIDGPRFAAWLGSAAADRRLAYRRAEDGACFFPGDGNSAAESDAFLDQLAGFARGNPGVARALWGQALRATRPAKYADSAPDADAPSQPEALWVAPWRDLEWPTVPPGDSREDEWVLHAVLLHGGLSSEVLCELLRRRHGDVAQSLHRLQEAEIVEEAEDDWRVTALGYPAVRRFLAGRGYLVDEL